ncbi:hypothetical protein OKA04_21985 [Luteolibacter flavescens]|uniref:Globin n=1 Tax=Luteolibacter flavescens TaxID=1859460 RepID=A0ABT3FV29_9BACT|nr:hypothetical protein [Luteolibacter flavescens]MCW1887423.1 hypothetical protein [Luteolibacter flavescens]
MSDPRGNSELPSEADFDPWGCLDAKHAWREFGGLSIEQAFAKFIANPLNRQEDFASMGPEAFEFYFPVLDRYLREYRIGCGPGYLDESYAAIIAAGISTQVQLPGFGPRRHLRESIGSLAVHVRSHLHQLTMDEAEKRRIDDRWQALQAHLRR